LRHVKSLHAQHGKQQQLPPTEKQSAYVGHWFSKQRSEDSTSASKDCEYGTKLSIMFKAWSFLSRRDSLQALRRRPHHVIVAAKIDDVCLRLVTSELYTLHDSGNNSQESLTALNRDWYCTRDSTPERFFAALASHQPRSSVQAVGIVSHSRQRRCYQRWKKVIYNGRSRKRLGLLPCDGNCAPWKGLE